ncbi:MAG: cytochrome C [Rhodospirillales bacterium]|nr:cytochrome C [Rhodospirillales bacterium]
MTFVSFLLTTSVSIADERYNPIDDVVVSKECGTCHMAFQPQMLPERSWEEIMLRLSDHFGEDASLDSVTANRIKLYLTSNAADSSWWGGKFMRGLKDHMSPLRITETPHWIREHNEEVPSWAWNDPSVKSKASCIACHPRANRGDYDDD